MSLDLRSYPLSPQHLATPGPNSERRLSLSRELGSEQASESPLPGGITYCPQHASPFPPLATHFLSSPTLPWCMCTHAPFYSSTCTPNAHCDHYPPTGYGFQHHCLPALCSLPKGQVGSWIYKPREAALIHQRAGAGGARRGDEMTEQRTEGHFYPLKTVTMSYLIKVPIPGRVCTAANPPSPVQQSPPASAASLLPECLLQLSSAGDRTLLPRQAGCDKSPFLALAGVQCQRQRSPGIQGFPEGGVACCRLGLQGGRSQLCSVLQVGTGRAQKATSWESAGHDQSELRVSLSRWLETAGSPGPHTARNLSAKCWLAFLWKYSSCPRGPLRCWQDTPPLLSQKISILSPSSHHQEEEDPLGPRAARACPQGRGDGHWEQRAQGGLGAVASPTMCSAHIHGKKCSQGPTAGVSVHRWTARGPVLDHDAVEGGRDGRPWAGPPTELSTSTTGGGGRSAASPSTVSQQISVLGLSPTKAGDDTTKAAEGSEDDSDTDHAGGTFCPCLGHQSPQGTTKRQKEAEKTLSTEDTSLLVRPSTLPDRRGTQLQPENSLEPLKRPWGRPSLWAAMLVAADLTVS
ncbi:hypothetical protein Cadr_000027189 [Camelus dromedarius]|uniref:Uncharacterized protein n=1 Tax=Camelus dromedarius TaxID=9838 RepID=A0A5N4C5D7_CAMDR|nr:hypothetical protein Cadr_000027189 [Camelus dromedarius]